MMRSCVAAFFVASLIASVSAVGVEIFDGSSTCGEQSTGALILANKECFAVSGQTGSIFWDCDAAAAHSPVVMRYFTNNDCAGDAAANFTSTSGQCYNTDSTSSYIAHCEVQPIVKPVSTPVAFRIPESGEPCSQPIACVSGKCCKDPSTGKSAIVSCADSTPGSWWATQVFTESSTCTGSSAPIYGHGSNCTTTTGFSVNCGGGK